MTEQFDPRYRLNPRFVTNRGVEKRSRFVRASQLEGLENVPNRPSNIDFFVKSITNLKPHEEKKVVGYFCAMIPPEIIHSFGAVGIRLGCGDGALVQSGEEVLSGEICPLTKASFAEFLNSESLANRTDCLIIPTACDAKKKLGEVLSDFKPVFMLNLPPEQDYSKYSNNVVAEFSRLIDFLSKHLGKKFSRKNLLAEIKNSRKRSSLIRKLQLVRSKNPALLSYRDLLIIIQSVSSGVDLDSWQDEVRKVLDEIEDLKLPAKNFKPRLLLTGAPIIWPNFKLPALIEESGADVVADTLCSGVQSMYDPVVIAEKWKGAILRALAQRYIFGSACPCFISSATRIDRILDMVDEHKIEGVVHYGLRLCQLFDIEVYRLSTILKQKKIPFINLRTDYSLEDTEQLRVRLEAFLETLEDD